MNYYIRNKGDFLPVKNIIDCRRDPLPVQDIFGNFWPLHMLIDEDGNPIEEDLRGKK